MSVQVTEPQTDEAKGTKLELIDVDVHQSPPTPGHLFGYMPPRLKHSLDLFGLRGPSEGHYGAGGGGRRFAARADSWPEKGVPGSDYDLMRRQLLDKYGLRYAVLGTTMQLQAASQPRDLGVAMTRAINDWTKADWLARDDRFLASICTAFEYAPEAVQEIERLAADPQFVAVLFNGRTEKPLGNPKYWDIFEAAEAHGLPVEIHVAGLGGNFMTGAGIPSYYIEGHTGHVQDMQSHLVSLVLEGALERFPRLQVVMVEGGFSWVGPMKWRLDRSWQLLREEVSLSRRPSEYVSENFWFTTQPMEEPAKPGQLAKMIADGGIADRLLFATDYPHWDFDAPDTTLPVELGPEIRHKIQSGNAKRLLHLS